MRPREFWSDCETCGVYLFGVISWCERMPKQLTLYYVVAVNGNGSRVVSVLDSGAEGPGFKLQSLL